MRNQLDSIIISALIFGITFVGCGPTKKLSTSTPNSNVNKSTKLKKSSPAVMKRETAVISKDTKKRVPNSNDTETNMPIVDHPLVGEEAFKKRYPSADRVVWIKQSPKLSENQATTKNNYKVEFLSTEKVTTVIYAENGSLIETRTQISPAQLPPSIYTTIQVKYLNAIVISASTVKSIYHEGSYAALLKTSPTTLVEYIFLENGTVVK